MPYTITEKILLAHTPDKKDIRVGEFIWAKVDLSLGNDITAPLAIEEFEKLGINPAIKDKIVLVPDHFVPAKDKKSAQQAKILKDFAAKYKIKHYYEVGRMGIEHALLPELGLVGPGDLVIGADSHTCTYGALGAFSSGVGSTDLAASWVTGRVWLRVPETIKFIFYGKLNKWVGGKDLILHTIGDIGVDGAAYRAMEFSGDVISSLPMDDRFTMCNMAIEAGGKSGIIEPDETTFNYVKETQKVKGKRQNYNSKFKNLKSDKDAIYAQIKEYDVSKIGPLVACPHLPSNVKQVRQLSNIELDQVVIGSCTNGRISDLRLAAKILKGRKVNPYTRCIVIPATQNIYLQAIKEGLIDIFVKSGAVVTTPTCGPCLGGHAGILTAGERCLATTNRNFVGRMGDLKSEVYLSNPAVAAASAVKGRIAHPDEVVG
ncbi:MAG: 3-isopropylmalate dehydratase large subunit [Candidatus Omnitrophota bacterium]|nr:3-isopropylmalate dehydratase large subunit [Candidatus Omnitrophota bacterium]